MVYLNKKALEAIKQHKYSGIDDSILYNYVLSHWWTYLMRFVPLWIAPNMITLIGTFAVIISFALVCLYCPDFNAPKGLPGWLYLLCSFCLLFYQTLDNLDGKQARRTQTSSPLGQLFDHGCDSLVTTIQALTAATIGGFGMNLGFVALIVLTWGLFWYSTWEEYHMGTLHLGYINGPEEGIVTLAAFFFATYWTGHEFWVTSYKQVFQLSGPQYENWPDYPMNYFLLAAFLIPVVLTSVTILLKVFKSLIETKQSLTAARNHLFTFGIFAGATLLWYIVSPEIWLAYPRIILCTLGLAFGEMVSRLICAHMAGNQDLDVVQRVHIPLILVVGITMLAKIFQIGTVLNNQHLLLLPFVLPIVSSYIHFAHGIIIELSTFLNIRVLRIPYKKVE